MKIPKIIKNLFTNEYNTNENKTKIIGLLTILIILWLTLYFVPEILTSLFNTLLGNLILLLVAILVSMYNVKYGIVIILVLVIIYRASHLKEGFTWTNQSTKDFLLIEQTINPQAIFDVDFIQKNQASQEELDYFLKNGHWPWSQKVQELYMEALKTNPYIRTLPESALSYTMTIYNEAAILRILSYQTKEGEFLLNGVLVQDPSGNKLEDLPSGFGNFPYEAGLIGNKSDDVIKCNTTKENGATLERITYTGKGGIYNEQTRKVTPVDYNNLESIIPGFKYLNGPCNPCGAINAKADYSCPFQLQVKDKSPFISNVWQYLWNINDNPLQSMPSFLTQYINPNTFPLLSELQSELKKENTYQPSIPQ
jgi:hypothetical protein